MGDKTRGMYGKFTVTRNDGTSAPGGKHDGCEYFVLDVSCDPYAIAALVQYAQACEGEYPLLAKDVRKLAQKHCNHETIGDVLHGPDTIGQCCEDCGIDIEPPDFEDNVI